MPEQKQVIKNLSNEEYHRGEGYREYLSSTQLKQYAEGAKAALYYRTHPELNETTPSMQIGTYLHDVMESLVNGKTLEEAMAKYVVFKAPVNESSGRAYGANTNKYKEALDAFMVANAGNVVLKDTEFNTIINMAASLAGNHVVQQLIGFAHNGENSGAEVSMFYEDRDGLKLKCRADLLTSKKIVDWKTTSGKLSPDEVVRTILNFGYSLSAAFYQYVAYKVTGRFYDFLWCFVQNKAPFDCLVVSAAELAFKDLDDIEMYENDTNRQMVFNHGVMLMRSLLGEHIWSLENGVFEGSEAFVEPNEGCVRILVPSCPAYAMSQIPKFYH